MGDSKKVVLTADEIDKIESLQAHNDPARKADIINIGTQKLCIPAPKLEQIQGLNPELKKAIMDSYKDDASSHCSLKDPIEDPFPRKRDIEKNLTKKDWEGVIVEYQHTGNEKTIAAKLQLKTSQVEHLINYGLTRLGLPSVKSYAVDQGQLNVSVAQRRKEHLQSAYSESVATVVQSRATQEAASARNTLNQLIETSNIFSKFINQVTRGIAEGEISLAVPELLTMDDLNDIGKLMDVHTKAMERAIKLVRLTQGEPTEYIEHQIGALLAVCSTEELERAAASGVLPKRLTSRISGADPLDSKNLDTTPLEQDKEGQVIKDKDKNETAKLGSTGLSADIDQKNPPSWLDEIADPEGASKKDIED